MHSKHLKPFPLGPTLPASDGDMGAVYSLTVFPASKTLHTRQSGLRRLIQSDRHADWRWDAKMCGQVAGQAEGHVEVDRRGFRGEDSQGNQSVTADCHPQEANKLESFIFLVIKRFGVIPLHWNALLNYSSLLIFFLFCQMKTSKKHKCIFINGP